MAGYWSSSFFACLWTETESRSETETEMKTETGIELVVKVLDSA